MRRATATRPVARRLRNPDERRRRGVDARGRRIGAGRLRRARRRRQAALLRPCHHCLRRRRRAGSLRVPPLGRRPRHRRAGRRRAGRTVRRGRTGASAAAPAHQPRTRRDARPGRDARRSTPADAASSRAASTGSRLPPPAHVLVQPGLPADVGGHLGLTARAAPTSAALRSGAPDGHRSRAAQATAARRPAGLCVLPSRDPGRSPDLRRGRSGAGHPAPHRPTAGARTGTGPVGSRHRCAVLDQQRSGRTCRSLLRQLPDQASHRTGEPAAAAPARFRHPLPHPRLPALARRPRPRRRRITFARNGPGGHHRS